MCIILKLFIFFSPHVNMYKAFYREYKYIYIYIFVYKIIFWNILTKRNLLFSMCVRTVNCGFAHT